MTRRVRGYYLSVGINPEVRGQRPDLTGWRGLFRASSLAGHTASQLPTTDHISAAQSLDSLHVQETLAAAQRDSALGAYWA
ncbi:MAG: hypothetical protein WCC38_16435 [Pseudonocardiaceae bacterium]